MAMKMFYCKQPCFMLSAMQKGRHVGGLSFLSTLQLVFHTQTIVNLPTAGGKGVFASPGRDFRKPSISPRSLVFKCISCSVPQIQLNCLTNAFNMESSSNVPLHGTLVSQNLIMLNEWQFAYSFSQFKRGGYLHTWRHLIWR